MIIIPPAQIANYIWLNGELIDSNQANLHLLTHSLHYSGGVFEGERAYNGKIFKLKEHVQRLLYSASIMQLRVSYSFEEIIKAHEIFIRANQISDAYVRPFIFRGCESLNMTNNALTVNLMIAATHSIVRQVTPEFNLHISRWRKPSTDAFPAQVKSSGHYNMIIVAQSEAKLHGFDDALMLDSNGLIAECTTANIFFAKDGKLYTPVADVFLNGITRQTVMEIARKLDIKTFEQRLTLSDINSFDECFITGTAAEIKKVDSITVEDKKISFKDKKITESLIDKYSKLVRS